MKLKIVKVISASLALALLLAACGGNTAASNADQGGEDAAAASQSKETEPAPEPAPAADGGLVYGAMLEEQIVYDDNGITITATGMEQIEDRETQYVQIDFTVENSAGNADYYFGQPSNTFCWYQSVSGYGLDRSNCGYWRWKTNESTYGSPYNEALPAGESRELVWQVPCQTLDDLGITTITDVQMDLVWGSVQGNVFYEGADDETVNAHIIPIELKTTAAGTAAAPEMPGAVVYEQDGITVSVGDVTFEAANIFGSEQKYICGSVDVWVRNETGKYMQLSCSNDKTFTINDKEVSNSYASLDHDFSDWAQLLTGNLQLFYSTSDIWHLDIPDACTKEGFTFPILPNELSEEFSEERRQAPEQWSEFYFTENDLADTNTLELSLVAYLQDTQLTDVWGATQVPIDGISIEFSGADARAALDAAE